MCGSVAREPVVAILVAANAELPGATVRRGDADFAPRGFGIVRPSAVMSIRPNTF